MGSMGYPLCPPPLPRAQLAVPLGHKCDAPLRGSILSAATIASLLDKQTLPALPCRCMQSGISREQRGGMECGRAAATAASRAPSPATSATVLPIAALLSFMAAAEGDGDQPRAPLAAGGCRGAAGLGCAAAISKEKGITIVSGSSSGCGMRQVPGRRHITDLAVLHFGQACKLAAGYIMSISWHTALLPPSCPQCMPPSLPRRFPINPHLCSWFESFESTERLRIPSPLPSPHWCAS